MALSDISEDTTYLFTETNNREMLCKSMRKNEFRGVSEIVRTYSGHILSGQYCMYVGVFAILFCIVGKHLKHWHAKFQFENMTLHFR